LTDAKLTGLRAARRCILHRCPPDFRGLNEARRY